MLEAVPEGQGAMAAILGLENRQVEHCCKEAGAKRAILEYGSGKVLSGLCKRLDRNITALVTNDQAAFHKSMEALK